MQCCRFVIIHSSHRSSSLRFFSSHCTNSCNFHLHHFFCLYLHCISFSRQTQLQLFLLFPPSLHVNIQSVNTPHSGLHSAWFPLGSVSLAGHGSDSMHTVQKGQPGLDLLSCCSAYRYTVSSQWPAGLLRDSRWLQNPRGVPQPPPNTCPCSSTHTYPESSHHPCCNLREHQHKSS